MTGAELTKRRKRLRLGPVELARTLGVTYSTVWRWEKNLVPIPPIVDRFMECLERNDGRPALET